jgi:hypothetical protein
MHGYTLGLLHGEGHEGCMQITMYMLMKEVQRKWLFSDFYEKQYLKLTRQLRILDLKLKNIIIVA